MAKAYVGNIPFNTTEQEIRDLFATCGEVKSVAVITDRETGRSRGFCFVEMDDISKAVADLNGTTLGGRNIVVNEARERSRDSRPRQGGGYYNKSY